MTDLQAVLAQMKQDRAKLDRAIAALSGVVGNSDAPSMNRTHSRPGISRAGRARIAAAQRARWAKLRARKAK